MRMTNLSRFLSFLIITPTLTLAAYSKTTGFLYNYDAICAYPFDDFTIDSLTCDSNSHIVVEGVNDYAADGTFADECHFGDNMEIEGSVTTVEAVSRYFDIYVHLCFKTSSATTSSSSSSSSSSGEKCYDYQTSLDLGYHQEDDAGNQEGDGGGRKLSYYKNADYDNHDYRNENYYEFLPEGTYAWRATFKVPTPTLSYRFIPRMTAKISFHPKQKYLGPELEEGQKVSYVWNGVSWHTFKTDCTASFVGVVDGDVSYGYRYQYFAAAAVMVLTGFGVGAYLARQGRIKFKTNTVVVPQEEPYDDDNPFHWWDYPGVGTDESLASTRDGTLRSLPLTRSQKVLLKALEGGGGGMGGGGDAPRRMIPGFVHMEDPHPFSADEVTEKSKRRLSLPRFLRRNR